MAAISRANHVRCSPTSPPTLSRLKAVLAEVRAEAPAYVLASFGEHVVMASGDPATEQMLEILLTPPLRAEVIEHAERHVYSN
jgi:hypothetical protein